MNLTALVLRFTAPLFCLLPLAALQVGAADATPAAKMSIRSADVWDITPDPSLPNVLILGDSISIGYTRSVRARLAGRANVFRPLDSTRTKAANCQDTHFGLAHLDAWLSGHRWDVVHFNWGLWDLCYRNPVVQNSGNRDKVGGKIAVPVEVYSRNLDQLVSRLLATGAVLVWASTTIVPDDEPGRFKGDDRRYNAAAAAVMARHRIVINDLHAVSATFRPDLFRAPSDVHPTEAGAEKLAAVVAEAVSEAFTRRPANPRGQPLVSP